ncbi:MAG: PHB depolymerase family esterase [Nevskia sp.]|nr:PHB depolymerase family esterase [Nevskia sp.]
MRLRIIHVLLALAVFGLVPVFCRAAVTDAAAKCDADYGDPPRMAPSLLSLDGDVGLLLNLFNDCLFNGGSVLDWIDARHERRRACLFVPPQASPQVPLPLVVFLQGSLIPAPPQLLLTDWIPQSTTADLSGDPQRPGFILLVPIGRNTTHIYPFPDNAGLGWDNWYRNLDRGSPDLNPDVAAIDHFIAAVESRGIVDGDRVYMAGWSNGAAMAQLYALNTPSVAAAAVYSSPDPFSDILDPCAQKPFASTMTPLMEVHNACDISGICQTGMRFHQELAQLFPTLPQSVTTLDAVGKPVLACVASCASQAYAGPGRAYHVLWPLGWNDAIFQWLREHPLNAKP